MKVCTGRETSEIRINVSRNSRRVEGEVGKGKTYREQVLARRITKAVARLLDVGLLFGTISLTQRKRLRKFGTTKRRQQVEKYLETDCAFRNAAKHYARLVALSKKR